MTYKTIFVDWDGTLSNSRFWDRWMGTNLYDQMQRYLFVEARDMVNDWMCGRISYDAILRYLHEETNIPYSALEEELRYSAEHMEFIEPEVPGLIKSLRDKGIKVVVATDNMDTFTMWTVSALELDSLFDDVLESYSLGALKSHSQSDGTSAFFGQYFDRHALHPKETVLIDNSDYSQSAKQFDMNFLHVNESTSLASHLRSILATVR